MKNNKKVIVIGIMALAIALISILGTYAYFLGALGETVNEKLVVKAGTMQLVFRDTDEIVTNTEATLNFGDTITKEFEIENTGTLTTYAKISWDNLINTYLEQSLTYKLEYKLKDSEEEWKSLKTTSKNVPRSEIASRIELANEIEIPSKTTYVYRVTITLEDLEDIDQTQDLGATLSTKFTLDEGEDSTIEKMIVNAKSSSSINFAETSTTDETIDGLYSMEDDYGMSYYFRGAASNNYVKFGKNKDGQDMWWRIIRINGDGSLRIQYDGTQGWENGTTNNSRFALTKKVWSTKYDDTKYAGWMYGGSKGTASKSYEEAVRNETSSDIKIDVDNWYVENIKNTGYEKYLSDEIFCNDRTAYKNKNGTTKGNGFGKMTTYYGGYAKFVTAKKMPSFKCPQKNDMFTMKDGISPEVKRSTIEGNKALDYPVGLITADEIIAAGGGNLITNYNYYLCKAPNYFSWAMTAYYYDTSQGLNGVAAFGINNKGALNGADIAFYNGAASPVINISPKYSKKLQGNGTINNPYELNM